MSTMYTRRTWGIQTVTSVWTFCYASRSFAYADKSTIIHKNANEECIHASWIGNLQLRLQFQRIYLPLNGNNLNLFVFLLSYCILKLAFVTYRDVNHCKRSKAGMTTGKWKMGFLKNFHRIAKTTTSEIFNITAFI